MAEVNDKQVKVPGTVPDRMKHWVILGICVAVIGLLTLSSIRKAQKQQEKKKVTGSYITPPKLASQQEDAQYEKQLQAMQLAAERSGQTQGQNPVGNQPLTTTAVQPTVQQEDPVKAALKQRSEERDFMTTEVFPPSLATARTDPPASNDPQLPAAQEQLTPSPGPLPQQPEAGQSSDESVAKPGEFNAATGPRYLLPQGTIIETVLVNRINGEFPGPVICQVSSNVYSHDGKELLIPAGTRVIGAAKAVGDRHQQRISVEFTRLLFPDLYSISLKDFTGLDQQGATALHDKTDNHILSKVGGVLAVGLLGGLAEEGTGSALTANGLDEMRQGVASEAGLEGMMMFQGTMNQLPTIIIREGTRVKIFVDQDLLVPAWENHRMNPDL